MHGTHCGKGVGDGGKRVLKENKLLGSRMGVGRSLDGGNCGVGVEVNWGILK